MYTKDTNRLMMTFQQSKYQITGHGMRTVDVLKEALQDVAGSLASDLYGNGEIIQRFQDKMATYLGTEASVFLPSGTMAQQIALRIWCDKSGINKVAYHPLCHLEIHEQKGLHMLHNIEPILLGEKDRLIQLDDVLNLPSDVTCLLLELPQREIGGQLPEYETLVKIAEVCRDRGIKLHLDGARLYEILPYYQKTAAEVCSLFDSVYVSFYKGIGGIAGAILAGDKEFIEESVVWKRRHGGDLISLYPYILSADYYFDKRIGKMDQYYSDAKDAARLFQESHECVSTKPDVPVSNMFHVHIQLPQDRVESILSNIHEATGIGFASRTRSVSENECSFEVSVGDAYRNIPQKVLQRTFEQFSVMVEGERGRA